MGIPLFQAGLEQGNDFFCNTLYSKFQRKNLFHFISEKPQEKNYLNSTRWFPDFIRIIKGEKQDKHKLLLISSPTLETLILQGTSSRPILSKTMNMVKILFSDTSDFFL